jgi:hypothetical protein
VGHSIARHFYFDTTQYSGKFKSPATPPRALPVSRNLQYVFYNVGRDSSVGIGTRYGLDGPGIESRWGARFSAHVQTGPGSHPASYTKGTGVFPGVKRPGRCIDHLPPSSAEVKGSVELYLYSSFGPSWPVLG